MIKSLTLEPTELGNLQPGDVFIPDKYHDTPKSLSEEQLNKAYFSDANILLNKPVPEHESQLPCYKITITKEE